MEEENDVEDERVKRKVAREEELVKREKVEKDVRREKLEEEDNIVLINKLI